MSGGAGSAYNDMVDDVLDAIKELTEVSSKGLDEQFSGPGYEQRTMTDLEHFALFTKRMVEDPLFLPSLMFPPTPEAKKQVKKEMDRYNKTLAAMRAAEGTVI